MGERYVPLFIPELNETVDMATYYRIHCHTTCIRHLNGSYKHGPAALVERAKAEGWKKDKRNSFYCPEHGALADCGESDPTLWDSEEGGMYVPKTRR